MKTQNETKNQHFVSQVEQRLNASNPEAARKSQKIYSFKVIDRENYSIELENNKSKSIENNLSWHDLFSFDIESTKTRNNFEALFVEYEEKIEIHTKSLLSKLEQNDSDIKEELLSLFIVKLLNSFRNPYCIKKTLNTVGRAGTHIPLDSDLAKVFYKVENGNKPQHEWLCNELGISKIEYIDWLKTLFILLMRPDENQPNILEHLVKSMYEESSHMINVFIFYYDDQYKDKSVLLSDRGFSMAAPDDELLAYYFNLCSKAFVTYAFSDIDKKAPKNTPQQVIDAYKNMKNNVSVQFIKNNIAALSRYNKNTVYQSFERVYCSSKDVYGL